MDLLNTYSRMKGKPSVLCLVLDMFRSDALRHVVKVLCDVAADVEFQSVCSLLTETGTDQVDVLAVGPCWRI